ncbi:hypothetical protein SAMN05443633_10384 [Chryseobacterium arachidis]|uniref:Uncharacterized protein n=1 Tax=Chryseobacterium arachidis TaxID=1416778 RepID=A0A1M4Z875_9FLAO|nr:hypothetical protein SAMN05443633_10384 [Chryseobacterium arachidis]
MNYYSENQKDIKNLILVKSKNSIQISISVAKINKKLTFNVYFALIKGKCGMCFI